ncbi:hypothetical protein ACWT_5523 [Actinoplanes sp. SE50]|nr:hypothetical protein ACPL_5653 [Actinoplanes sp. SE50/110]ATO84938.1 hypothetical protein ACWT_5523 [Actinoplanes sp. SE50]SLM02347.1 hypothetical protein ACSP50_5586 [Actinoplanes sp. SE50/110]
MGTGERSTWPSHPMTEEAEPMTNARLIERLIDEATQASDWRSDCTDSGRLPVFNLWGSVMYLTPAGEVVIDHEEDSQARLAEPAERDFALARAAEQYPELAYLKPAKPLDAVMCNLCTGRGWLSVVQGTLPSSQNADQSKPFFYCPECASLGWTMAG